MQGVTRWANAICETNESIGQINHLREIPDKAGHRVIFLKLNY